MSVQRERQEIVRVIKPFRLIDAESYERAYWRRDGQPLPLGFYVVDWPARAQVGVFNEEARFRGPYPDRQAALRRTRKAVSREATSANPTLLGARLGEPPTRIPERWRVKL